MRYLVSIKQHFRLIANFSHSLNHILLFGNMDKIISCIKLLSHIAMSLILFLPAEAQRFQSQTFEKYNPVSTLVVPQHYLTRSRFPFIDVHNHQYNLSTGGLSSLITEMEKL